MDDKRIIESAEVVQTNMANADLIYGYDKFANQRGGHGFAAEKANHLYDLLTGNEAKIVGDDNAKNGADRLVNGIEIQSKYCKTGSKCIAECFDETGKMRYTIENGTKPMQIEVPSDLYDSAVQAMEDRIKKGQVPGVTDPAEAKNIVRKGNFTYQQAQKIAKAGTIESITFDSVNGVIIATNALGISALITFGMCIWNNESFDSALSKALSSGMKVGGTAFLTSVIASQLTRTSINTSLKAGADAFLEKIGPKASSELTTLLCGTGNNIYGEVVLNNAAKVISTNILTGIVSFAVLSSFDVADLFRDRISGKQLFKNMTVSMAGMIGMYLGYASATALIEAVSLGFGTAIIPFISSMFMGVTAFKGTNQIMSKFIEDDADEMVAIIQIVFKDLSKEYMITSAEADSIMKKIESNLDGKILKIMYASQDRKQFAYNLLIELFLIEVKNRKRISIPDSNQMARVMQRNLDSISDFSSKVQMWKENHVDSTCEAMCIIDPKYEYGHDIISELDLPKSKIPYVIFGAIDKQTKKLNRHSFVDVAI